MYRSLEFTGFEIALFSKLQHKIVSYRIFSKTKNCIHTDFLLYVPIKNNVKTKNKCKEGRKSKLLFKLKTEIGSRCYISFLLSHICFSGNISLEILPSQHDQCHRVTHLCVM